MQKELVVFSVSDWSAEEVARLCHDALASSTGDEALNVINTIAPIGKLINNFFLKTPPYIQFICGWQLAH